MVRPFPILVNMYASGHRFGGGSGNAVVLDPRYWFPQNNDNSMFAKRWAFWYNDPTAEDSEEPPEEAKHQMELYDSLRWPGMPTSKPRS